MREPAIENRPLRYATSFLVLAGGIVAGTLLGLAVPDSVPHAALLQWAVIVPVALLTIEGMRRLEGDVGLLGRWLGWDRR